MSTPSAKAALVAAEAVKRWVFQPESINRTLVDSEFPLRIVF